jgi:fatty acid desaturase
MQVRGMIEHHRLWVPNNTYDMTQLDTSRNIQSGALLNFLVGGLPHHSLHQAYPSIPYNQLPKASSIAERVLQHHGKPPLPRLSSYWPAWS